MWRILRALGYVQIGSDQDQADLVIAWHDDTYPTYPEFPVSRWGIPPINGRCHDISKKRVGEAFASVFGYELSVDPATFQGPCISKFNMNATHNVTLHECPVETPARSRVYERYVDTMTDGGYYEDIRIAVVGAEIPICWKRINAEDKLERRFAQKSDDSILVPTAAVLGPEDVRLVLAFCSELGLDFCELDAGRDRADGRLYIFDATSTPTVRRRNSDEDNAFLTRELSAAFTRQFQPLFTYVP